MFDAFFAEAVEVRQQVPVMDRVSLGDVTAVIGRVRGALDGLEARVASALDGLDDHGPGASTTMRSRGGCSQRKADKKVRRAKAINEMPTVVKALDAGDITGEHADVLVRAAKEVSPEEVDASGLAGELAGVPADLAARRVREWTRRHRPEDPSQSRHERQRARRKLFVFKGDGDMIVIHGEFDSVTGAQIEAEIDAEMNRLFQADGGRGIAEGFRTVEQRRADALHNIVCRFGVGGSGGPSGGRQSGGGESGEVQSGGGGDRSNCSDGKPGAPQRHAKPGPRHQIVIVADLGVITDESADGRSEIVSGGSIPKSVLSRLACNSELMGMVFSGDGQPLWHGRKVRTATDAQVRALVVRDQGCVVCDKAPKWCEAHHVQPWQPPGRGPTDIDNLVLVCSHHHHLVHDHRWRLRRSVHGYWFVEPPEPPGSPGSPGSPGPPDPSGPPAGPAP